jgi:hypothetical protein
LLDALLGADPSLGPLKPLIIERTGGNPFFVEETVRTLVETGSLVGTAGAYRLTGTLGSIKVPATVRAVVAARIDRLSLEDKSLLQEASVIGTDVPLALLARVADLPEAALRERIVRLVVGEFLYETRLFPDLLYTFTHAITHDVAYSSLLNDRRRGPPRAHRDPRSRSSLPTGPEKTWSGSRHHSMRGEVWAKAESYLRQAAARRDQPGGARRGGRVSRASRRGPGSPAERAERDRSCYRPATWACATRCSRWASTSACFVHLQAAERLATERGDAARLARTLRYLSTAFPRRRRLHRARPSSGTRAVQTAALTGDVDLEREAKLGLALVHYPQGHCLEACESPACPTPRPGRRGPAATPLRDHAVLGHHARLSRAAARRARAASTRRSRPPRKR